MMLHAPATLYPTVVAHVTRPAYLPHVAQPFPCAPRGELTDLPCADHLAVVLSQAYADKVDPAAARHAMIRRRFRMAQKQICYIDDIDMDVVGDCVVLGEQRDAAAFLKAHTQAAEAKNKFAAGVAKLIEHVCPCVMADVEKARENVDAKKVRAATRQARRFFQAQLEKDFLNAVLETSRSSRRCSSTSARAASAATPMGSNASPSRGWSEARRKPRRWRSGSFGSGALSSRGTEPRPS